MYNIICTLYRGLGTNLTTYRGGGPIHPLCVISNVVICPIVLVYLVA